MCASKEKRLDPRKKSVTLWWIFKKSLIQLHFYIFLNWYITSFSMFLIYFFGYFENHRYDGNTSKNVMTYWNLIDFSANLAWYELGSSSTCVNVYRCVWMCTVYQYMQRLYLSTFTYNIYSYTSTNYVFSLFIILIDILKSVNIYIYICHPDQKYIYIYVILL